jgi:ketosteroid isomerase-like protein
MALSDTAKNKSALRKALNAYKDSPDKFLALADPKIVWTQNAPKGYYPFAGTHRGRDAVFKVLGRIAGVYKFKSWKVVDIVAEGDNIWTACEAVFIAPSNKPVKFTLAGRWTFRNGKAVRYVEFFDTASALIQEGRIGAGDGRKYAVKSADFRL